MSKNKGPPTQFIVLPAKNFGTEGKWRVQEYVYFVDRLKSGIGPNVIIDYDNWKVLKDYWWRRRPVQGMASTRICLFAGS